MWISQKQKRSRYHNFCPIISFYNNARARFRPTSLPSWPPRCCAALLYFYFSIIVYINYGSSSYYILHSFLSGGSFQWELNPAGPSLEYMLGAHDFCAFLKAVHCQLSVQGEQRKLDNSLTFMKVHCAPKLNVEKVRHTGADTQASKLPLIRFQNAVACVLVWYGISWTTSKSDWILKEAKLRSSGSSNLISCQHTLVAFEIRMQNTCTNKRASIHIQHCPVPQLLNQCCLKALYSLLTSLAFFTFRHLLSRIFSFKLCNRAW